MGNDLDDLRDVIADRLRQVNTCMPGRINKYDPVTRKAEVQPLIKEKYADGTILTLPPISAVPVIMPATQSSGLALPIGLGDTCLLLFAQRSIDRWLAQGGISESADKRMHALSDAIALVGIFPFNAAHADGDGLLLYNNTIKLRMAAEKIAIGNVTVELLDEITKALDEIATLSTTWGAATVQVQLSSAAIKTIKGTI